MMPCVPSAGWVLGASSFKIADQCLPSSGLTRHNQADGGVRCLHYEKVLSHGP